MAWRTFSVIKAGAAQPVLASATTVVSSEFAIRNRDRLRIDVTTSVAVTAAAQSAKLQTANAKDGNGAWIWADAKSVSITSQAGYYNWTIVMGPEDATDYAKLPLGQVGRVVIISGIGDTSTVAAVAVTDNT